MLFYNTVGTFGSDDFEVICEEVFLLDIGSSAYTEYETDDPEFIKWLMADTKRLEMKKGHCHSHQGMPTFFSGTDNEELVENAPNHNIYVSLIVNNKNINMARVAFKVTEKSITPIHVITTTVTYKDQEGKDCIKEFPKSIPEEIRESEAVYVYDCEIEYPSIVGDTLTSRFQELSRRVADKQKKADADRAKKQSELDKTNNYVGISPYGQSRYNSRGGSSYRQTGLFDDSRYSNSSPEGKKGGRKNGVLVIPPGKTGKQLMDDIHRGDTVKKRQDNYANLPKSVKTDIYNMLGKLLSLDPFSDTHVARTIAKINFAFYPDGMQTQDMKNQASAYYDGITDRAREFYHDTFPTDKEYKQYKDTMLVALEVLSTFDANFPELIDGITQAIELTFSEKSKIFQL